MFFHARLKDKIHKKKKKKKLKCSAQNTVHAAQYIAPILYKVEQQKFCNMHKCDC